MQFPDRFADLPPYAFPRLRALIGGIDPGLPALSMSIGEPQHPFPDWVQDEIAANLAGFGKYPPNNGSAPLLAACADWVSRRYGVQLNPETELMAVNGSREGLYNIAMALSPEHKNGTPVVLAPNPFYQVYAVAAASVGAEPLLIPATAWTGHLPDYASLPEDVLNRVTLAYLCSPSNPQGVMATAEYWTALLELAERYDFKIVADECYSEIYREAKPTGILEVAKEIGADPERVIAFHSLSKRSNMPGLRSGFVATGPQNMARIQQLRAYSGSPLPLPLQAVAQRAWGDESHVEENRRLYRQKFELADEILGGVPGYQPV
ncbi:MAG: aminotransferase class I/II-fold pyridoxal phosphate-dependent enzyme, partial [Mangrovicoccus sp.]